MPKLRKQSFPERHMGLVPTYEHQWAHDAVDLIAELAEQYLDIPAIAKLAGTSFTGTECAAPVEILENGQSRAASVKQAGKRTPDRHYQGFRLSVLLP